MKPYIIVFNSRHKKNHRTLLYCFYVQLFCKLLTGELFRDFKIQREQQNQGFQTVRLKPFFYLNQICTINADQVIISILFINHQDI